MNFYWCGGLIGCMQNKCTLTQKNFTFMHKEHMYKIHVHVCTSVLFFFHSDRNKQRIFSFTTSPNKRILHLMCERNLLLFFLFILFSKGLNLLFKSFAQNFPSNFNKGTTILLPFQRF